MSLILCKYCGKMYDSDFHSICPTGNHVEDCDFPFKVDEAGNINSGYGDLVLEVCPHNDWIVNLLINSTNLLPCLQEELDNERHTIKMTKKHLAQMLDYDLPRGINEEIAEFVEHVQQKLNRLDNGTQAERKRIREAVEGLIISTTIGYKVEAYNRVLEIIGADDETT